MTGTFNAVTPLADSMNRLRFQLPLFAFIRTVFNAAHRMVYPFLGVFARGLGVDVTAMSLALTARATIGTFGPFAAAVADDRGRKFGMLLGLGIFTLGIAIVVFWPTLAGLTLSLVLSTMGKYIFDPGMQAHLGDRVPYEQRGLAIAITETGWSLAFIAGIPLIGFLIRRGGWMAPFPLLASLGILLFAGLFFLLPSDRRPSTANPRLSNFKLVLTSIPALAGLSIGLWASAGNEVVNLIFGVWLEDAFRLQIAALAGASAVIGLSELGGEGLVAAFVDKLGKPRAVALGLTANSLAALALPWLGSRSEVGALTGLSLFYITFEFTIVSSIPMMTEVLPSARATLMAFNVSALSLGRALGAPLAPMLYRFGFPLVTVAAVAFNVAALLALRRMSRE